MHRERILITVKTYPTLSRKHGETVCTAGIREDGSWVRLYPVPFRRLDEQEQYRKFDWIELNMRKGTAEMNSPSVLRSLCFLLFNYFGFQNQGIRRPPLTMACMAMRFQPGAERQRCPGTGSVQ
jgi:hypothetical protein